ncbi:unnamed protein product, partial [Polarella glacialis]
FFPGCLQAMASEVAPCMPLQFFRRATGSLSSAGSAGARQQRPQDVCRRLTEDLDSLAAAGLEPQDQEKSHLKSISEDTKKHLQVVLEVLESAAERCEKARLAGGTQPSSDGAGEMLGQFLGADLPTRLVASLAQLEFEVRKDVVSVLS